MAGALATPVHLATAAITGLGVWVLWPGSNWVVKLLGVLVLCVAWVVRPRLDRTVPVDGVAERYVRAAVRSLRAWEQLLSPYRPEFRISAENQLLLVASGGRTTLESQARAGLTADVVTLLLTPFRLLASGYCRLLERRLPESTPA